MPDWPHGGSVSVSGKSTINYSPQRNQQHMPASAAYFGQVGCSLSIGHAHKCYPCFLDADKRTFLQGPATSGLPMPGPGFFSSPDRPTAAYGARFMPPGAVDGAAQLHPPRPGFIGTIASPATTQTAPAAATAGKPGKPTKISTHM